MSDIKFWQLIIAALVPASAFITWLVDRRRKSEIEDRDSTAAAMESVTKSATLVVNLVTDQVDQLQSQIDRLNLLLYDSVEYIKILRSEMKKAGLTIPELPDSLSHLDEDYHG